MAVLKCKMCGGDIIAAEGQTYGTCDSCGSTITLPNINDQRMENLFNRANHFRMVSEFDKAVATYEMILNEDNSNAEAHWGLLLSRYGIEYVEDPASHERIPTCHRIQNESILSDDDYVSAIQNAPDSYTRSLYEAEGKRLSELQRGLLQVSAQTDPFDIFICYKETTEGGSRTNDSALAQDIYYQLTNAGYKVFFSRVTLESMLGQQYEPHIFAALNSAKVMLAIGTKPEYFNAVWVKNEWSRFLALSKKDRSKVLIPCYRDMNVYDLPDELSMLQSQDMSKIGFMQDLLHGIEKVINAQPKEEKVQPVQAAAAPGVESLYKRAILFLEDGDFQQADEYFDRILDIDPEFAPAYIGRLQVERKKHTEADLANCHHPFDGDSNYKKAIRFANSQQKAIYEGYNTAIHARIEAQRLETNYNNALSLMNAARNEKDYREAAANFAKVVTYKDAAQLKNECLKKVEELRAEKERKEAERKAQEEQYRLERERQAEIDRIAEEKRCARNKKIALIVCPIIVVVAAILLYVNVIKPEMAYNDAGDLYYSGRYDEAYTAFARLENYKESRSFKEYSFNKMVTALAEAGDYEQVIAWFERAEDDYDGSPESIYQKGVALLATGNYDQAIAVFDSLIEDNHTGSINTKSIYQKGVALFATGDYDGAIAAFESVSDYNDAASMLQESMYQQAVSFMAEEKYSDAYTLFAKLRGYKDVDKLLENNENLLVVAVVAAEVDKDFSVGNYVTFGRYYDFPVEWQVLKRDGSKALLFSRYGLAYLLFNDEDYAGWAECSLRNWLNEDFLNDAFNTKEQKAILTTTVTTDAVHPDDSIWDTENAEDKLFLLSLEETDTLFPSIETRTAIPAQYLPDESDHVSHISESYWLRTPAKNKCAYAINTMPGVGGALLETRHSFRVDKNKMLVRPALWIDLESGVFWS